MPDVSGLSYMIYPVMVKAEFHSVDYMYKYKYIYIYIYIYYIHICIYIYVYTWAMFHTYVKLLRIITSTVPWSPGPVGAPLVTCGTVPGTRTLSLETATLRSRRGRGV